MRGPVDARLAQLDSGALDGLVIAEAALIRLQLTHRNRVRLEGAAVPFQGRLAIVGRADDTEMEELFECVHCV